MTAASTAPGPRTSPAYSDRPDRAHRILIVDDHLAVLSLMAQASDAQRIADQLGISVNTARGYVQQVLEKLDAHSRLEAVVRANELGLLSA